MTYRVVIERKALKFLENVPKKDHLKIKEHIDLLAENSHPHGSIKLEGSDNIYRLRYGNYRSLYTVENEKLIVYVNEIGIQKIPTRDNLSESQLSGTATFSIKPNILC